MATVLQTPGAEEDLLAIGRHIARESSSLDLALRFLDRIAEKCALYATQPRMATYRPDLGKNIHTFAVDSYVVIYQPITDGIRVLMVIHGARNVPPIFNERYPKEGELG